MSTAQASVTEQAQGARSRAALDLVRNHVIGAMAVGMLPLPLLDIALLTALQLRMIARLTKIYRIPFSHNQRGITTFTQLAETDVGRLQQILHEANLRMADPRTWPEQAKSARGRSPLVAGGDGAGRSRVLN